MLPPITRLLLTLSGVVAGVGPATAQTSLRLSAGATIGSALVRDELGGPVTLRPGAAPTVAIAASHSVGHGYRIALEGQFGSSSLKVTDNGSKDDLGALRTLGMLLLLDGPIAKSLRWQAGAGALLYRPAVRQGVFLENSPTRWLLAAGADWSRPVGKTLALVLTARYDFSTFTTRRLDTIGYSQFTAVQRVGLFVGLERRF